MIEWESAYKNDGKGGITAYATQSTNRTMNKYAEDFAESVAQLYINGPEWFNKNYPNRAKILYQIFPSLF